jgi:hypothetical protein
MSFIASNYFSLKKFHPGGIAKTLHWANIFGGELPSHFQNAKKY